MDAAIKAGAAAACEYVEANRKETAVRFVVDAFNGKVDSILSRTKADNHGKLQQEIRDAFSLVNENGRAFRNARILPEYFEARLEELKWGAVAHELRNKEREEQRQIKERIREEEKARREYEKALKDAAKEEETLRKAMEKAQKEIEKASDAQKAKYEEQLRVLSERLKEAEARSQRATSMAQLTKAGHVYVISNIGSFGEEVFKIGMTRRLEPADRIRELGDASVPFDFDVHALIYSEDAPGLERDLHKRFLRMQMNKVNPRKEFFKLPIGQIREAVDRSGCQAKWTMTAEARQFKESLAIERSMRDHTLDEAQWADQQMKAHEQGAVEVLDEASA